MGGRGASCASGRWFGGGNWERDLGAVIGAEGPWQRCSLAEDSGCSGLAAGDVRS